MYKEEYFDPAILFEESIFDACNKHPEIVQNYAAMLALVYYYNLKKSTEFIFNWIYREKELSIESKHNLLHLYTLIGTELLNDWDLDAERLSNVIHPNNVNNFTKKISKNELILNLHLTYIQYFGQINDGVNISKSFNFIGDYFENHSLSHEDDVDLTLFFNSWSRYDMTVNYLLPKFENNEINEDGVFTLAQTMSFIASDYDNEIYELIQKKASELNTIRWCDWINRDFQILRNHHIKRIYCEICK